MLTERLTPSLAGYVLLLVLGLVLPVVVVIGYLLVALYVISRSGDGNRAQLPRNSRGKIVEATAFLDGVAPSYAFTPPNVRPLCQ